jgi:hypothetical protein
LKSGVGERATPPFSSSLDTQRNQARVFKKENVVSSKASLPWDLEQAMTAFQVKQSWYENYWLRDINDLACRQVHRRPDGSIDIDYYRRCAKCERDLALKQAFVALLAMLVRLFRLAIGRKTSLGPYQ